jgi:hypothetical protein
VADVKGRGGRRRDEQPRRNTFGCNLVDCGDDDIADKVREPSLVGAANGKRVRSIATMSWASTRHLGDDVDFSPSRGVATDPGPLPASATLGRVKDAFRYGRNVRER